MLGAAAEAGAKRRPASAAKAQQLKLRITEDPVALVIAWSQPLGVAAGILPWFLAVADPIRSDLAKLVQPRSLRLIRPLLWRKADPVQHRARDPSTSAGAPSAAAQPPLAMSARPAAIRSRPVASNATVTIRGRR